MATAVETPGPPAEAPAAPPVRRRGGFLDEAGDLTVFAWRAIVALRGTPRYASEVMRINAIVTRRTTLLLFVMCVFLGLSAANFGFFFLRAIGAGDFVGFVNGLVTARQIAPQMFGYVVAGSVSCAIAAELGAAKIQEEIAAYEANGVDPMQLLVGSRILGVLLYVPLATIVSYAGCLAGGYLGIVVILEGNSSQVFLTTFFGIQTISNVFFCFLTLLGVALTCTIVACFYGMRATGGPDAVGRAVARSLSVNLVLLHLVVVGFALIFYGSDIPVPIGD